ncbi:MAG: hypothetical protein HC896_18425 [Bacteroidales bacterium]|nr:hypothetical protein [Bacteroidales bacterium]
MLSFTGGHYIYDYVEQRTSYPGFGNKMLRKELLDQSWHKPGDNASYPRALFGYEVNSGGTVDYQRSGLHTKFLHKGDYVRLRNVQIGYNLNSAPIKKLHVQNIRIYASLYNLWLYSPHYKFEPEGDAYRGSYQLPQTRSYTFGANFTF